jgi:hypothetical protein
MAKNEKIDIEAVKFLAQFAYDPYKFVIAAFPWGEPGPLEHMRPQAWQKEILNEIRDGFKTPDEAIREAVASGHGIGKAHSNDTVIDTPNGRKVWGDIKPGDYVFGANGKPVEVIACRRYEKLPIYRVVFDDDSSVEVSSGHLWQVRGRQERRKGLECWRVVSTQYILEKGVKRKNGGAEARQWEIPIQGDVEYSRQDVPVPPYILGIWLGDGSANKAAYSKPGEEIRERIKELGYEITQAPKGYSNYIKGIKCGFDKLDVFRKKSPERFIPAQYKYNDVETRKELLCGLLDSDGEINPTHSIQYDTTSRRLADDIIWLVRSLGGKAQIQPTAKKGWYYGEDRQRVEGKDCWRVTMTLPFNPFRLKHRKERYKADIQHRYKCRWIDRIEYVGEKPGQCITVNNPDGLYLTNDFIVTHNSALVSWIILWAMATHADTRGVVTANTDGQLKSKTWVELATWYHRFICKDMFVLTATSMFANQKGHEKTWRIDAIPWSERNTEAFAGLHNHGKRILIVFDEASAIIDKIWEVTEGAMSDKNTEKIWVAFGNPTRTNGRFYDCFHRYRKYWQTRQIDSRTVDISDKKQIAVWEEQYGEDSDFFKVRVRGVFPSASDSQFISRSIVDAAVKRVPNPETYRQFPVIIGIDPAWTGSDSLEIVMRQGPFYKHLLSMQKNDNDVHTAGLLARLEDEYKAAAVFIDSGYGQGIYSAGQVMGRNWQLVSFAGKPSDEQTYANKRAEIWGEMKEWLKNEGTLEDDQQLIDDLTGPEAFINTRGKLQLESKDDMKRRGVPSPNKADALALTFTYPVTMPAYGYGGRQDMCNTDYDPFA